MPKIKWIAQEDIDKARKKQEKLNQKKAELKKKAFHTLPTAEKWELVEIGLRQLGLLEDDPQ